MLSKRKPKRKNSGASTATHLTESPEDTNCIQKELDFDLMPEEGLKSIGQLGNGSLTEKK